MQTERQISEQSRLTTLEQLSTYGRTAQHTEKRIEGTLEDIKEGKDTLGNQIEEQSQKLDDFHKALAGLERENRELTEIMKGRDAQSRESLMEKMKAQEAAIEDLRDKIVAAEIQLPDDAEAPAPRTAPPRVSTAPLTIMINKDTPLRLPLPSP
ncbi:MAG: hypothetical protein HY343_03365 [Lentisphaerae bacterium]|nr:hypothetical protein [Lentisphaerota bacterium]